MVAHVFQIFNKLQLVLMSILILGLGGGVLLKHMHFFSHIIHLVLLLFASLSRVAPFSPNSLQPLDEIQFLICLALA